MNEITIATEERVELARGLATMIADFFHNIPALSVLDISQIIGLAMAYYVLATYLETMEGEPSE